MYSLPRFAAAATLCLAVAGPSIAGEINLREAISGTFSNTAVDTNGDTQTAIQVQAGTKGTLGHAMFTGLQEGALAAPSGNCDPQQVDLVLVTGAFVHRFQNGDLLVANLDQGAGCLDLNTLVASVSMQFQIAGGTGRFEGAEGSYTMNAQASPLVPDIQNGGIAFGIFNGEITGTVETQ